MGATRTELVWQDPPTRNRGRATKENVPEAELLKTRPDTWAMVYEYDKPTAAAGCAQEINRARRAGYRDGNFTAKSRTVDGRFVVYVKYVPAAC